MNDYLKCHHCQQPLVKEEAMFTGKYYAHVSCQVRHEKREETIAEYNVDKGGD